MTIDTHKLRRLINLPIALGKLECQDGGIRFVRMRTVIDCNIEVWGRQQIDEYTERLWAEIDAQAAEIARLRDALNLALEYWSDRQQRYKNRAPVWVEKARAALSGEGK